MKKLSFFDWRGVLAGAVLGVLAASAVWFCLGRRSPRVTNFSSRPQGRFPGLAVHESDFLIPLNRLILTPFVSAAPPDESGDRGRNRPATVLVFGIREGECIKYFLVSGIQGTANLEVKYLGADITVTAAGVAGNGYHMIEYAVPHDARKHRSAVPLCLILGSPPEAKNDISQPLMLTPAENAE